MSLAGLSLRDLEYLLAVAETRHFGRAAERCAVSQPALSAQIRKLEGLLGVTVFERQPGRVLVTPRGEAVLAHAARLVADARALLLLARQEEAPLAGPFHLGAIPTLGPYLLPHLLRPMRETFAAMRPVLSEAHTAQLVEGLKSGTLDAALCCTDVQEPGLHAEPVFFEPFLLMHQPDRVPAWPPPDAEEEEEVLLLQEGHCLRDQTLALCSPAARPALRHATGLELLRHMVAAGEGWSLMPALAAAMLGPIEGLVTYTPPGDGSGREVALLTRSTDPRGSALSRLAELLRGIAPAPARALPGPGTPGSEMSAARN